MVAMATLDGGGGWSTASLYHTCIRIHASCVRGGLEAMRDSTTGPTLAALRCRSSWILALIKRMISLEVRWAPVRRAAILTSMRRQVSRDIYDWQRCSHRGGLGITSNISADRRLTPPGVVGGLMEKRVIFPRYRECETGVVPRRNIQGR